MPELNCDIPVFECLVRNEFLYNFQRGHGEFSKAVPFAVASVPGRAVGFHCLLDNGAVYGRLPIHALTWAQPKTKPIENVSELQLWDAPSEHISCITYDFLKESRCHVLLPSGEQNGTYMFTLDWWGSSYSESAGALGWKCIGSGSLVLTEKGYVPVELVEIGTKVLTHKGNWKCVISKSVSVTDKLCMFKGKGHPALRITSDHKILTYSSSYPGAELWEEIEKAREWASVRVVSELPVPTDFDLTPEFMRFVGTWLGDGTLDLSQRKNRPNGQVAGRVILTSGTSEKEVNRCKNVIEDCGFTYRKILSTKRTANLYPVYNKKLANYLLNNFGRYSHGKYLPGWVFGLKKELKEALLLGYFEADGHQESEKLMSITSVSKALIFGFKQLAETMGYTCSVYFRKKRKKGVIICGGNPCNVKNSWALKLRKFDPSGKYSGTITDTHIMSPIYHGKSARLPGYHTVWDLEVEEDNSFIVEGVVVHNCSHMIRLDNGYFALQPNNRILWECPAFVKKLEKPDYALTERIWKCEGGGTTGDNYFYDTQKLD